jgi:acyl carrier protein
MKPIAAIFSETLHIDLSWVTDDLTFNSVREWDSVAHMALVAALEEAYEVMLEPEDIIDMNSVRKAKEILLKYGIDFAQQPQAVSDEDR